MRELRHLRLIGIADEQRRAAGKQRHRRERAVRCDGAQGIDDIRKTLDRPHRRGSVLAEARAIRRFPQPHDHGQVDERVEEDAVRGAEMQQRRSDSRAREHAEIARRGDQPHRAWKLRRADHVVEKKLRGWIPQHAGHAVHDEQHACMPHLELARVEQHAPRDRHARKDDHAKLDDPARIEPIAERARRDGQQQERQPVRNDCEAAKPGRFEFLEDDPVADDVLAEIRGHHGSDTEKEDAKAGMAQRAGGARGDGSSGFGQGARPDGAEDRPS